MYQLTKLENNLKSILKKFNITETIDIKLTKNESFDLQINKLAGLNALLLLTYSLKSSLSLIFKRLIALSKTPIP